MMNKKYTILRNYAEEDYYGCNTAIIIKSEEKENILRDDLSLDTTERYYDSLSEAMINESSNAYIYVIIDNEIYSIFTEDNKFYIYKNDIKTYIDSL